MFSELYPFTWFEFPFCFAVPTRFLRRITQQQHSRNIKGLSVISLSIDCDSTVVIWSLIDFESSPKHDGIMYIFVSRVLKQNWGGKLDQLRVGQFYCHFWPIFSLLFYNLSPRAHNIHNRNARRMAWFETKWKVCFWTRYFPLFLFSPTYAHGTLTENSQTLTTRACLNTLTESQ